MSTKTKLAPGSKRLGRAIRWNEFAHVMRALDLIESFDRDECLRVADMLKAQVAAGKVVQISRTPVARYCRVLADKGDDRRRTHFIQDASGKITPV